MRYPLIAIAALFAALLLPQSLHAAGNVLLPKDTSTGNASSVPNLGIGVLPKAPMPVTEPVKKPEVPPAPAPVAAPAAPPKALPPVKANPPPASSSPTRIITETEPAAQTGEGLPNSLTIFVSDKSSLGANDVTKISDTLGLSREQISASCILASRGMVKTDKSIYSVPMRLSSQTAVKYDGAITGYMMTAQALCRAGGPIPQRGGIIVKMGDRYIVSLQPINCNPPNGRVSSLTIAYDGSPTTQCVYQ